MNFIIGLFIVAAVLSIASGHAIVASIAVIWVGISMYAKRKFAQLEQGSDQDKDQS